jgi:prepilin-type N-terminal cleavage/methylation domain-containing protein
MIMKNTNTWKRRNSGFTLIEVLIGILIFALGMMALAKLQGNLARNSGDANARTVATNIAEEVIEEARIFGQIDSDGTNAAYHDVVDGFALSPITRGNIQYTVASDVTDYYYDSVNDTFTDEAPVSAGRSDFKQLDLTVTWNTEQEFQVDGTNTTSGGLGSGSIRITDVISSITSGSGGKVVLGTGEDTSYAPPVNYHPGANPDIISISLGENKFKESTTPLPDVIRTDEMVETRFDVVTYSQAPGDDAALFLRREEFLALSCECTLRIPDADGEGGLRPTIWEGSEYSEAEFVSKPYGETADNRQSDFCGICCRDHHDGGAVQEAEISDPGRAKYNPFQSGDHQHYSRVLTGPDQGTLVPADSDGDSYVEACRLIRKDGFFRVAQDLRQEGLNNFPADYLAGPDAPEEVSEYATYVTDAVTQYELAVWGVNNYQMSPPNLTEAANMTPAVVFPASTFINASVMEPGGITEQQLRTRGIYIDYMDEVLQKKIGCLLSRIIVGCDDIDVPNVTTVLEIIPFYDVQLTWLARWNESPNNIPVDVTNDPIESDNLHNRGIASIYGTGYSTVSASAHKGNLGLTGTDPIDPGYAADLGSKYMYILSRDPDVPPILTNIIISGTITTAIPGQRASDVNIEAEYAECDRTNTGYECVIHVGSHTPTIKFSNYDKASKLLVACSVDLENKNPFVGANSWTKYDLPKVTTPFADIVITEQADCAL